MNSGQSEPRPYFGGLDAIRTYAFFIVFISHVYFSFFTVTEWGTRWFAHGEVGVHMFFVLSAFLITYLSLSEYSKTGSFSVLHFFKKRILRIWPLYFFVLFLSYAWYWLRDSHESLGCLTQFLYFFGNACIIQGSPQIVGSSTVAPMWSVSVEQQFYVLFPLALLASINLSKKIGKKIAMYMMHTLLSVVFVYALYIRYRYSEHWNYISYAVVTSLPAFIIGIYLAYGVHIRSYVIEHVKTYSNTYNVSALVVFFSFLYVKFQGTIGVSLYIVPIIYATCIWIIIGTKGTEEKEKNSLTLYTKIVRYLGKISYGLYAYHMFAIVIFQHLFNRSSPWSLSFGTLVLTICFAHISFKYIESWFLKFK
jgi:peptidoglycan/LPS O-acetylase OafA/YrhL